MVFKRWQIVAGIALLVTSSVASALSLGRVRGTALLGRSLDLSIQSTMEPSEALPEASCLSAEVFYGDTRVSSNAVSITPERVNTGEMRLRLRASTVVDEPVVTLFVRSTCGGASSRRYVLLAEALSEADTGGVITITPAQTPRAPAAPLTSPRIAFGGATPQVDQVESGSAPSASGSANQANSVAANRRAERAEQRQKQRSARLASQQVPSEKAQSGVRPPRATSPSVMRKAESAKTTSPRLQVDLLDLTTTNLGLRGSAELASAPSSDEAVRRQAQALWRALNASPEEAMRESLRLEGVDAQMRVAQEKSKRQAQDIAKLSTDLAAAQDARYVNPLTIGLGLLALAALALSFVFWQRSRNTEGSEADAKPWWRGNSSKNRPQDEQHLWNHLGDGSGSLMQGLEKSPSSVFSAQGNSPSNASLDGLNTAGTAGINNRMRETVMPSSSAAQQAMRYATDGKESRSIHPVAKKSASVAEQGLQKSGALGLGRSGSGQVDNKPPAPFAGGPTVQAARGGRNGFGNTDFAASGYNAPRVVAAEELFDIQEQADFFLSLGQPDQAIEVLKNHITDNVETSALAYMDLFDIYHRTGRKAEYFELREEFNRVFNAQVPDFSQYGARSNGLEDFPHVLEPIEAAWSRPHQAQDVIEESIFRQPEQDQTLDMAAYRELMLLYALAKELTRPDAAYSMLPISMQIPVLPDADDQASKPDLDLGDDLLLSLPTDDLLAPDDRTVSLPYGLVKPSVNQANDDGSLDFDLSDSAALLPAKKPSFKK